MLYVLVVMKLEVNTKIIDMDVLVGEQITANSDGSYTIFLNARLSHERQMEAYAHALRHIQNRDFSRDDADAIEKEAHNF